MDSKMILQNYLLFANISEYLGSMKSLVELMYWVIGETTSVQSLERTIAENMYIGNYYLAMYRKDNQVEVCIKKMR